MIDINYDHIWDTCCDHGLLGRAIYLHKPNSAVHFVDVMPHLIKNIHNELSEDARFNDSSRWSVHALDSADIPLQTDQSHLVIIAGVGGDLLLKLVQDILLKNPKHIKIDFILCPVRQLHKVRFGLKQANLALVSEQLIKEFSHYYELLHVSNHRDGETVGPIGETMWNLTREIDQEYLKKNVRHYGNMCKQTSQNENIKGGVSAQYIYDLYKALETKL